MVNKNTNANKTLIAVSYLVVDLIVILLSFYLGLLLSGDGKNIFTKYIFIIISVVSFISFNLLSCRYIFYLASLVYKREYLLHIIL